MWKLNLIEHATGLFPQLRKKVVEPHKFGWLFTVQTWLLFDAAVLKTANWCQRRSLAYVSTEEAEQ